VGEEVVRAERARQRDVWSRALDVLSQAVSVHGKMERLAARDVAGLAEAFGSMHHKNDWLLVRLAARILARQLLDTLSPAHVASICSAFAALRHADPALLEALVGVATSRSSLLTMTSSDADRILKAYGQLGVSNELLRSSLQPIAAGVQEDGTVTPFAERQWMAGVAAATQALACE